MRFERRWARAVMALGTLVALTGCDEAADRSVFTGYVEAEYVYVAAPDSGWLVEAPVSEGDEVAPGDPLFALDPERQQAAREEAAMRLAQARAQARDLTTGARAEEIQALEAELSEAEAARRLAETERARLATLVKRGVISKSQLDGAVATYDEASARSRALAANIKVARLAGRDAAQEAAEAGRDAAAAALKQADWALDQRRVAARVAGRVELIVHRKGEFVAAGQPVLALLPPDGLKVRFFAPEAAMAGLRPGARVLISADALAAPVAAVVSFVAAEAEFSPPVIYSVGSREKLVFMIEARPEQASGLRPGLPVDVRLE